MISVVINVYNGEKYIKKCLSSIINQTYKDLEILVINDGSTDDTIKVVKSFKDKRINFAIVVLNILERKRHIWR